MTPSPIIHLAARDVTRRRKRLLNPINCHSHGKRLRSRLRCICCVSVHRALYLTLTYVRKRCARALRCKQFSQITHAFIIAQRHVVQRNRNCARETVMEAVKAFVKGYSTSKTSKRQELLSDLLNAAGNKGQCLFPW